MNDQTAPPQPESVTGDKATIDHLLLFFALVYVVEGLGQIGGLIAQPLNNYLKAVAWLDAAADHRLHHAVQPALDHQAGLRPGFRFRAAVRLSAQKLPAARQRRRHRRLLLGDADSPRRATCFIPLHDHRLHDGDIEHAVRRGAGGERPAAARERHLRQSAMAVVQHCRDGGRRHRRPAGRSICRRPERCTAPPRSLRWRRWPSSSARCFWSPRRKVSINLAGHERHASRP